MTIEEKAEIMFNRMIKQRLEKNIVFAITNKEKAMWKAGFISAHKMSLKQ